MLRRNNAARIQQTLNGVETMTLAVMTRRRKVTRSR